VLPARQSDPVLWDIKASHAGRKDMMRFRIEAFLVHSLLENLDLPLFDEPFIMN
jgi:hypothetical protein